MPGPFPISINSIALFYLLPFISVGVYTIGTQKFSLANFLLLLGGITALHSVRLIYEKSYKTENQMLEFVVCFVNRNPFPDKIKDPNKARAIVAIVITFLMIIA